MDQYSIQKAQYVIANFQQNPVALKIAKKKQLEIMDWTTDEIDQAMQFEEQMMNSVNQSQEEGPEVAGNAKGEMFNNNQMLQQQTA